MRKVTVRTNIHLAIKVKGISMAELARRVWIGETHLSHITAGRHEPRVSLAMRIANALGLSVEELFFIDSNGDQATNAIKKAN